MDQVLETFDRDFAEALLSEQYAAMRMSGTGAHHVRIAQAQLPGARLDWTTLGMRADFAVEPMGTYCLGSLRSGRVRYRYRSTEVLRTRGELFLVGHPDEAMEVAVDQVDADWAVLDTALLGAVAQPRSDAEGPVRLLDRSPTSAAAAAEWSRVRAAVRALVDGTPGAALPALVAAQAARLLAAATLAAFPSTAVVEPTAVDRHDAHPATLRAALAFMESHADVDLSAADIAAAASVTVRAVQLAFRRHLGTTPMAHLRRIRLHHAHDDLRRGDPGDTVTAVAARWGFARPSRFTALYRAEFGAPPSATLRGRAVG
ncbi:helix-turn-helix domain-containing protein [Actinokineospora bangkokensis]|uniref:HTH araC/xylS-type domain-containing protein n=1 Tax=Actinokineospora bangkokensis TaxID=1193682 RepID=A0A1Q9LNL5_9PSEU|nr:helix-turn-helix domain-containing protein [Actinokineospora bangkokensis]OLR93646.1 hypothetical protein BJP25_15340 [Actinokineospora bangkokensis]